MRIPVLAIGLILLVVLGATRIADPAPLSALRYAYFDALQRLSPRQVSPVPVRIVDIDEASLAALGQWPWPRDRLAELTRRLDDAGAAVIAFDVIFAEPDRLSPIRIAESPGFRDLVRPEVVIEELAALDTDAAFASSIRDASVVLGTARTGHASDFEARGKLEVTMVGEGLREALPALGPATSLVPELADAASGIGAISVGPGTNGSITRTMPLLWAGGEGVVPSLALEALRIALQEDGVVLWGVEGATGVIDRITVGTIDIPTTPDGQLWLRARSEDPTTYLSAASILSGAPLPDLDGTIVLVGTSAAGLLDLRTTALGQTIPGVAVHAQAVEQILTGQHLVRSELSQGLELLLFVSGGLLITAAMSLSGPVPSVLVGTGSAFAAVAASWAGFRDGGLLIDATLPLLGSFLMFSLLTLYRLFVTDRDARHIRKSFSHYVAPDILRKIESGEHSVALGGADQEITVMFSDIRNFTALSERLDAQGVVALLNRLFATLSDQIMEQRGTIDKFMGDSVMAFWNAPVTAPDHALRACRAALAMRQALDGFNRREEGLEVKMGIGLATGMACVGNIGSRERFNYTAVGETVNRAARLESACRQVEYDIVASREIMDIAPSLAWLPAGALRAKGVSDRIDAAILVGDESLAQTEMFRELRTLHDDLVSSLEAGRDAIAPLARAVAASRSMPGLAAFYLRIEGRREDFLLATPSQTESFSA